MAYDNNSPAQGHQALSDIDIIRNNCNELRKCEASLSTAPPSNPVGGQFWWNTDTTSLYQRNQANTTWNFLWSEADLPSNASELSAHTSANITSTVTVHGIRQGSGNGFDADKLDGNEASAFLAVAHGTATSGVHGSGSSILLHLPANSVPMFVVASTAPTGWTQNVSYNDRVIRVVSGTGGGTGGGWAISGLSTEAAHTHGISTDGGHTHGLSGNGAGNLGPANVLTAGSHSHGGATAAGSGHTHSGDGNWRPSYLDVLAITKNP